MQNTEMNATECVQSNPQTAPVLVVEYPLGYTGDTDNATLAARLVELLNKKDRTQINIAIPVALNEFDSAMWRILKTPGWRVYTLVPNTQGAEWAEHMESIPTAPDQGSHLLKCRNGRLYWEPE